MCEKGRGAREGGGVSAQERRGERGRRALFVAAIKNAERRRGEERVARISKSSERDRGRRVRVKRGGVYALGEHASICGAC